MKTTNPIIFTDLDGTLLDFKTYSFDVTKGTVEKLTELGIPVVFCSSKTRVEQEVYRKALGNAHPFITENGSAIFIPEGYFAFDFKFHQEADGYKVVELGETADFIRAQIKLAREESGNVNFGYADLTIAEISEITTLDLEASKRAASREYSETILKGDVSSEQFGRFKDVLEQKGLACVSGGKFHTVMGLKSDKGKAVEILAGLYRKQLGEITTLGLGDSANDGPLLRAVDKPYLVQKPNGTWQAIEFEGLEKVAAIGPAGWNEAVAGLLE
ncbi:mannosyl-3-phosphoglycerate phosphatase [Flammeovirgaceae bacterium SG7u.111]|nr:mannosyl-3-phosphoglycerate phosphatase [Flammeovirgaceae bacterium SG7u.132]WPO37761.1 mannosyl-3-phosphoglycerate phosphatase [Flammeovirgaceae bacterium SG7u.111]